MTQTVTLGQAVETNTARPLTPHVTIFVRLGQAVEQDTAFELEPRISQLVPLGQAVEDNTARPIFGRTLKTFVPLGQAVETNVARPIGVNTRYVELGQAVETETAMPLSRNAAVEATGASQRVDINGGFGIGTKIGSLILEIVDKQVDQAPTCLVVTVSEAIPEEMLQFYVDGVFVYQVRASSDGSLWLNSIPIYEEVGQKGEHLLMVTQENSTAAVEIFNVRRNPSLLPTFRGPDASPIEVPAAIRSSGFRSWVLQDLMPGGLGSWVMPINPEEMDNPAFERVLSAARTTALDTGMFHVYQAGGPPQDWSFRGYGVDLAMVAKLKEYGDLQRRFYLIDHRGRAWIVMFTQVSAEPRLRQNDLAGVPSDEVHDYTVSAIIYNQEAPVMM